VRIDRAKDRIVQQVRFCIRPQLACVLGSLQIGDSGSSPGTNQSVEELLTKGWLALAFGDQPSHDLAEGPVETSISRRTRFDTAQPPPQKSITGNHDSRSQPVEISLPRLALESGRPTSGPAPRVAVHTALSGQSTTFPFFGAMQGQ
jgi:hypothetical protein